MTQTIHSVLLTLLLTLPCFAQTVQLQVLGSGGPELGDGRASSGYLIWIDGKARVLVDAGPGTAHNFEKAGANIEDLRAILVSHFHVDHSSELPAYLKGAFFTRRTAPLYVYGPTGTRWFPSTEEFVDALFGESESAYPYLSDYLGPNRDFQLVAKSVEGSWTREFSEVTVSSVNSNHGPVPARAWKVEVGELSIVFSGDFSGKSGNIPKFAKGCDILVCHNAIPPEARGVAARLHATPAIIAEVAAAATPAKLVLSHRMTRTLGREQETLAAIRAKYEGPVEFAEDLQLFEL